MKKSNLRKRMSSYNKLLKDYKIEEYNDGCVDSVKMVKENISIEFSEDLREHITNFYVITDLTSIKVYFRAISYSGKWIDILKLEESIDNLGEKNNVEKTEIDIYFSFLINNGIL